jgi:hypothetical protein
MAKANIIIISDSRLLHSNEFWEWINRAEIKETAPNRAISRAGEEIHGGILETWNVKKKQKQGAH